MMTTVTAMRTANTKKAVASRAPKVESTAEVPFFEIERSNLGSCRVIGWNPERLMQVYRSTAGRRLPIS
jgi:hypothetical protein